MRRNFFITTFVYSKFSAAVAVEHSISKNFGVADEILAQLSKLRLDKNPSRSVHPLPALNVCGRI
jgi:hypothetical protein